jgi:hypothetical protein
MNSEMKAMEELKLKRAFESGQNDAYRGLPMRSKLKVTRSEIRSYIKGYHSMVERKSYG